MLLILSEKNKEKCKKIMCKKERLHNFFPIHSFAKIQKWGILKRTIFWFKPGGKLISKWFFGSEKEVTQRRMPNH